MWIPAEGRRQRYWSSAADGDCIGADSGVAPLTTPAPIEFLGAESYLTGEVAPFWNSSLPFLFLKTESNCSLTAYTDDPADMSIGLVQTNYQDILHAQAASYHHRGPVAERLREFAARGSVGQRHHRTDRRRYLLRRRGDYLRNVRIDQFDHGRNRETAPATALESSPTSYTTPGTPATLTSVDVNGDGKPDLVVVSDDVNGVATVSVFLGNGDGTYKPGTDYATQLVTGAVTVADVNKDGHPDLIVVGQPSSGTHHRSGGSGVPEQWQRHVRRGD